MAGFGISAALLTPFAADGAIDAPRLARHARDLLARGVRSVTLFGTTGEGASVGLGEREAGLAALLGEAGIAPDRIVLGLCGTSVEDVHAQIAQGLARGVRRFLVPPPFYFADASQEGLADWFAALFAVAGEQARFILYHIPQLTRVPLSLALIVGLKERFGDRVIAVKDSSGSWDNARALLDWGGTDILVGDERLLHRAVALGAAGSISGMANLYPERLARVMESGEEDADLSRQVDHVVSVPVIPALKAMLATASGAPGWERLRPPLRALDPARRAALLAAVAGARPETASEAAAGSEAGSVAGADAEAAHG